MAARGPGGGGGIGRGSSGSGGGGGGRKPPIKPPVKPVTDIKTKKPLSKAELKKREAAAKKTAAAKAAKIPADRMQYGPVQKLGMNPPKPKAPVKPAKPAQKPLNLTTRGKAAAVVGTGVAVVGTTKGMKKAGEMNAARIRRNKSKSVPVPRNPRKQ
jgi:hypothetical protein